MNISELDAMAAEYCRQRLQEAETESDLTNTTDSDDEQPPQLERVQSPRPLYYKNDPQVQLTARSQRLSENLQADRARE